MVSQVNWLQMCMGLWKGHTAFLPLQPSSFTGTVTPQPRLFRSTKKQQKCKFKKSPSPFSYISTHPPQILEYKVVVQYLCEPFSALLLSLHAVRAMCNTSCVPCRSSIHCQNGNVNAYLSSRGGPRVRCVCFCSCVCLTDKLPHGWIWLHNTWLSAVEWLTFLVLMINRIKVYNSTGI